MSSESVEDDAAFAVLPLRLKRRIDQAFDAASSSHKRLKPAPTTLDPSQSAGGFLVDDVPAGGFIPDGGGFLPSTGDEESSPPTHVPLSLIPTALQLLDIQPDDEDVLAVFQNASTGWGDNSRARATTDAPRDPIVSRKDWRAVCAALLDTGPSDADTPASDVHAHPEGAVDALEDLSDLTADSAEEYVGSGGTESGSDDSDDDYQEGGFVSAKKIGAKSGAARAQHTRTSKPVKGRTLKSSSASDEESEDGKRTRLTARQKQECRSTFALFFPDVTDEDLDRQRIRMNDITRVAKLLKEKISTEETVEMLEAFSTAPDKSMSLADFECMMVAAKMA